MASFVDYHGAIKLDADAGGRTDGPQVILNLAGSYAQIVETFGEPDHQGIDGKVFHEWEIGTPMGAARLYDWKENEDPAETGVDTVWNVSAPSAHAVALIGLAIQKVAARR